MIAKLIDNLGSRAYRRLGVAQYARLLFEAILSLPAVLRDKKLVPLDRRMSRHPLAIRYAGRTFRVDVPHIDTLIREENSLAFGAVRELYIRDCYFRFHEVDYSSLKNVVDLGGNRGMFSALCSSFCSKIVIVEPQEQYNEVIGYNLRQANPRIDFQIIHKFIGGKGKLPAAPEKILEFRALMQQCGLDSIDFLKIDIEGAEFALFQEDIPFEKVRYLSMEVHRDFGRASELTSVLERHHFQCITATADFRQTSHDEEVDYIYARNKQYD